MSLHIVACQRVIAKHRNMRRVSVAAARDTIQRLATADPASLTREDQRIVEHLERVTGCTIGALAVIASDWPEL